TGADQAAVSRRAIVLRMFVSGIRSISPVATGATGAIPIARAPSTSLATMRPSGPLPVTEARSTPRSRARRRASGDALTRPLPDVAEAPGAFEVSDTGSGTAAAT